jgi:Acyl-coenzyme A:6-aminopenicillanic acid acyl-transferase
MIKKLNLNRLIISIALAIFVTVLGCKFFTKDKSDKLVNFEDIAGKPLVTLIDTYGSIDWGNGKWAVYQDKDTLNNVLVMNNESKDPVEETFSLPKGKVIKSLKLRDCCGGKCRIVLKNEGNPDIIIEHVGSLFEPYHLEWTKSISPVVKVEISDIEHGVSSVRIDDIVFGSPFSAGFDSGNAVSKNDTPLILKSQQNINPTAPLHTLNVVEGNNNYECGRKYGLKFKKQIHDWLNCEVYRYVNKKQSKESMLEYAAACAKEIKAYSPEIMNELEGTAEGSGLPLNEMVLLTLHEELYHRGILPSAGHGHCTTAAVGPGVTSDGNVYIGQNWDWWYSMFGKSELLLWRCKSYPDVLCYSYPGIRTGSGMNSAGIALVWTSIVSSPESDGPRVGVPTYILIAHLLNQTTIEAVIKEAQKAKNAGWFTFVIADDKGNFVNVEGSPKRIVVKKYKSYLTRVEYGTPEMTNTPAGKPVKLHPRGQKILELVEFEKGRINADTLKRFFLDNNLGIHSQGGTVETFIFNTSKRTMEITRGLGNTGKWQTFSLERI